MLNSIIICGNYDNDINHKPIAGVIIAPVGFRIVNFSLFFIGFSFFMSVISLIRDWVIDPIGLIFLLSLLMLAVLAHRRFSVSLMLGGLIWLAVLLFVSAPRLVNPMLLHYENQYQEQPDCLAARPIVVLGGGVDSRAELATQVEFMNHATFVRSSIAIKLAKTYPDVPVLLAGGALRSISEAEVMGYFVRTAGLAKERVHEEGDSRNTFENATNIRKLIDDREFDEHINLVTSALHMKRARAVFEKQGLIVCSIAVDRQGIENVPNFALWPQISALQKFDLLLHEQLALILYKVKGLL